MRRPQSHIRALAAFVVFAGVAAHGSAAAPSWTSPVELSATGSYAVAAIDAAGTSHVAWIEPDLQSAFVGSLKVRSIDSAGFVGAITTLATSGASSPVIAAGRGTAIAAWLVRRVGPDGSPIATEVWASSARGGEWDSPRLLDTFDGNRAKVAMDHGGNGIVVWGGPESNLPADTPIAAAVLRPESGWEAPTQIAIDGSRAEIVTSPNGHFLAAWSLDDGTLAARPWSPSTGWGAIEQTSVRPWSGPVVANDDGTAAALQISGPVSFAGPQEASLVWRTSTGTWTPGSWTSPPASGLKVNFNLAGGGDGPVSVTSSAAGAARWQIRVFDLAGGEASAHESLIEPPVSGAPHGDSSDPVGIARNRTGDTALVAAYCQQHEFGPFEVHGYLRAPTGGDFVGPSLLRPGGATAYITDCVSPHQVALGDSGHGIAVISQRTGVRVGLIDPNGSRTLPATQRAINARILSLTRPKRLVQHRRIRMKVRVSGSARVTFVVQRRVGRRFLTAASVSANGGPGSVAVSLRLPRAGSYRLVVFTPDSRITRNVRILRAGLRR